MTSKILLRCVAEVVSWGKWKGIVDSADIEKFMLDAPNTDPNFRNVWDPAGKCYHISYRAVGPDEDKEDTDENDMKVSVMTIDNVANKALVVHYRVDFTPASD